MPSAFLRATKPAVASLPSRAASANATCSPASASGARMRVPMRAPAAEKRVTASGSHWFSMGETAPSMQSVMVNSVNTVTFALQRRLFQARRDQDVACRFVARQERADRLLVLPELVVRPGGGLRGVRSLDDARPALA